MSRGALKRPQDRVFTRHLRSLRDRAEPREGTQWNELWQALRTAVRSELRKRDLWHRSPSYLGILGSPRWSVSADEGGSDSGGALDELVLECYVYVFVQRRRHLEAHMEANVRSGAADPNIDGLVFRNIRNFLYERQKSCDPLGFRIFEVLQSLLLEMISAGRLHVLAGDPRIRNDTLLGFTLDASWQDEEVNESVLRNMVHRWNNDLLPGLITGRGEMLKKVTTELSERLCDLPGSGFEAFRFHQLIQPLKNDIRDRWFALYHAEDDFVAEKGVDGEIEDLVKLFHPGSDFESRYDFEKLSNCIGQRMHQQDYKPQTRAYLNTLWRYLQIWAAEPGEVKPLNALQAQRELRIPRKRLPNLKTEIGKLLRECQETDARGPAAGIEEPS